MSSGASNAAGAPPSQADEYTCPVCLELLCRPYTLVCQHSMCAVCLELGRSLCGGGLFRCPVCRHPAYKTRRTGTHNLTLDAAVAQMYPERHAARIKECADDVKERLCAQREGRIDAPGAQDGPAVPRPAVPLGDGTSILHLGGRQYVVRPHTVYARARVTNVPGEFLLVPPRPPALFGGESFAAFVANVTLHELYFPAWIAGWAVASTLACSVLWHVFGIPVYVTGALCMCVVASRVVRYIPPRARISGAVERGR
jgi:hypothetical protein